MLNLSLPSRSLTNDGICEALVEVVAVDRRVGVDQHAGSIEVLHRGERFGERTGDGRHPVVGLGGDALEADLGRVEPRVGKARGERSVTRVPLVIRLTRIPRSAAWRTSSGRSARRVGSPPVKLTDGTLPSW